MAQIDLGRLTDNETCELFREILQYVTTENIARIISEELDAIDVAELAERLREKRA